MLSPRKGAASTAIDDRFYVAGGFDGSDIMKSVEFLDARTRKWMEGPPMKQARCSAVMMQRNEYELIVLGGTTGIRVNTGEILDIRINRWQPLLNKMLQTRSGAAGVAILDNIYCIGGIDGNQKVHNSIEMCDMNAAEVRLPCLAQYLQNAWWYCKSMAQSRLDASASVVSNSIIVTGGQADGEVFGDVSFYRTTLDEWHEGPPLLVPRFGHSTLTCVV